MTKFYEQVELLGVIMLTLLAKWLMTEEPHKDDLGERERKLRNRKAYGGIVAGGVVAYYGHIPLIENFDFLNAESDIPVVIVLAISGEHLFRALITKLPDWIKTIIESRLP